MDSEINIQAEDYFLYKGDMNTRTIKEVSVLFEEELDTKERRELLGHSLFYYCCGIDTTPILAFAEHCPLYVYVDIIKYGHGNFDEETGILYKRLQKAGFQLIGRKEIKSEKRTVLTQWRHPQSKPFFLLYVGDDARQAYHRIYKTSSDDDNNIIPKCICNYKYEFERFESLEMIEKRTEYILGHCYSVDKYRIITEYDYFGDYGETQKVPLYKRIYWYLY